MPDVKTFVTFETDLAPVTSLVADEPPGRLIAEAIVALLAAQGLQVDGPHPYADYGWEIEAWKDAGRFWFIFQRSDEWMLIAEERTGLFAKLMKKSRPSFDAIQSGLAAGLKEDARFRSVRWFTREEFQRSGTVP